MVRDMKLTKKKILTSLAILPVAGLVALGIAVAQPSAPVEPKLSSSIDTSEVSEAVLTASEVIETSVPEAPAEVAPVAPVVEAPAPVVEQPAPVAPAPVVEAPAPEPVPLTTCPEGSFASTGDETGDTSCLPEICRHIMLPDPVYPECETPFKP